MAENRVPKIIVLDGGTGGVPTACARRHDPRRAAPGEGRHLAKTGCARYFSRLAPPKRLSEGQR
jgi:hypothetical protein